MKNADEMCMKVCASPNAMANPHFLHDESTSYSNLVVILHDWLHNNLPGTCIQGR